VKKIYILILLITLAFGGIAHAEDVYCGDYNGKPVYVRVESISKNAVKSDNEFKVYVTDDTVSVYNKFSYYYKAHLIIEDNLYEVLFSDERGSAFGVTKLLKGHDIERIYNMNLNFALNTVINYYNPDNFRANNDYMNKFKAKKDAEYNEPYMAQRYRSIMPLNISQYQTYKNYPSMKGNLASAIDNIKSKCKYFSREELIELAGEDTDLQKIMLGPAE